MPGNDPFVRHDSQILVGDETTQGTAVAPTRGLGKITGETEMPDPSVEWQENRSITAGASRELSGKQPGRTVYDGGTLPIIPRDGYPIAWLLGADSVTTDTGLTSDGATESDTGTTLHTITVSNDPKPPTKTVEATYFGHGGGSDFVRTFAGCAPPTGSFTVDNEGELQVDLDLLALDVTTGTSATTGVSEDTRDPWLFHDAESNLSINGTEYARVTNFEWEVTTNIEARYYIQNSSPEDPFELLQQNLEHNITVDVVPDDSSLYDEVTGRDDSGDATIQFYEPNADERLRFEFANVGTEEAPHPYPEEGTPEVSLSLIPDSAQVLVEDTQATSAYV
jgi:hypothetical protein